MAVIAKMILPLFYELCEELCVYIYIIYSYIIYIIVYKEERYIKNLAITFRWVTTHVDAEQWETGLMRIRMGSAIFLYFPTRFLIIWSKERNNESKIT